MAGEAGEVAEKIKKVIRDSDGEFTDAKKLEICKELGDVLWYISAIATDMGMSLENIARNNKEKLESRQKRDVIGGSGDNR